MVSRPLAIALLAIALALAGVAAPAPAYAQSPSPCAVAAAAALSKKGLPYIWGQKGPFAFDCSGLVYWAWSQAGYDVGLSTYDQSRQGVQIACSLADLAGSASTCWQAGDLIFLRYTGGQHVAMYIGEGLFADAYNRDTGVIVHNPATDSFYQAHYWQSRRIVSCDGVTVDPGSPSTAPISTPGLEDLPDLLSPVSFSVPQCGACSPSGPVMPPTQWDGQWPSGTDMLNVGLMVQTAISWLAWRVSEMLRILICWLLAMLATLAGFLASMANVAVAGINGIWKLLLFQWLAFQAWFSAFYYLISDLMDALGAALAMLGQLLSILLPVIGVILALIGIILGMLSQFVSIILGVLGWVGGLVIGMFWAVLIAIGGVTVPTQLTDTYTIYYLTRGMLEGLRDSTFGWGLYLFWALCYVWFVFWLSRFVGSKE